MINFLLHRLNEEILHRKSTEKKAVEIFSKDLLKIKMLDEQVKLLENQRDVDSNLPEGSGENGNK